MDLVERYASSDPGPGPAFLPSFLSHCVPLLQPATDPALWRLVRDGQRSTSQPAPGSTWAAGRRVRIVSTCSVLTIYCINTHNNTYTALPGLARGYT